MGRVQHPRTQRQRVGDVRCKVHRPRDSLKGTTQGRQGTQTQAVGRVGRQKVCWVGRYAYIRHADSAAVRRNATGLVTYDYDLLVAAVSSWHPSRHDAIEWVHKHVLPLSDLPKPALRIIYKKD